MNPGCICMPLTRNTLEVRAGQTDKNGRGTMKCSDDETLLQASTYATEATTDPLQKHDVSGADCSAIACPNGSSAVGPGALVKLCFTGQAEPDDTVGTALSQCKTHSPPHCSCKGPSDCIFQPGVLYNVTACHGTVFPCAVAFAHTALQHVMNSYRQALRLGGTSGGIVPLCGFLRQRTPLYRA